MGDVEENSDWFKEFQQINKSPTPKPVEESSGERRERRRFLRFEVDEASTVLYREGFLNFIGVGKANKGRTALDLSTGGVRLTTSERVAPGTRVRIKIRMDKYNDDIDASGVVRWCHQDPKDTSRFEAGVMFVGLNDSQSKKIALMRDWFTSPQYKAVKGSRVREKENPDISFPT